MYSNSSTTLSITTLRFTALVICVAVKRLHAAQVAQQNPQSQAAVEDKNKVLGDFWSPKLDG